MALFVALNIRCMVKKYFKASENILLRNYSTYCGLQSQEAMAYMLGSLFNALVTTCMRMLAPRLCTSGALFKNHVRAN